MNKNLLNQLCCSVPGQRFVVSVKKIVSGGRKIHAQAAEMVYVDGHESLGCFPEKQAFFECVGKYLVFHVIGTALLQDVLKVVEPVVPALTVALDFFRIDLPQFCPVFVEQSAADTDQRIQFAAVDA